MAGNPSYPSQEYDEVCRSLELHFWQSYTQSLLQERHRVLVESLSIGLGVALISDVCLCIRAIQCRKEGRSLNSREFLTLRVLH
jgi:hypothetical protein